ITADLVFWSMPAFPDLPAELVGAPIVIIAGLYAGPADVGERMLQPLREFATPLIDLSHAGPYVSHQSAFDPFFPDTQRYYWKSIFADHLTDDVIDATIALAAEIPSTETLFALRGLGGAMGRVPEDATAYSNRAANYNLSLDTTWQSPDDDARMIAWTREAWSRVHALTGGGVYLNFAGLGEENDTLAHAGYGSNYDRLQHVKRRYDPTNLFRTNVNIKP
ncbi:MAG: BBE domain-containing protein, partial [Thermomicrobiales bacterium]